MPAEISATGDNRVAGAYYGDNLTSNMANNMSLKLLGIPFDDIPIVEGFNSGVKSVWTAQEEQIAVTSSLSEVITQEVEFEEYFYFILSPIVKTAGGTIKWTRYNFRAAEMDILAERTQPRILGHERTSTQYRIQRHGIGYEISYDLFNSSRGPEIHNNQLLQMINSINQTIKSDILYNILLSGMGSADKYEMSGRDIKNANFIQEYWGRRIYEFAILQKDIGAQDPLKYLYTKIKTRMQSFRAEPDTILIPVEVIDMVMNFTRTYTETRIGGSVAQSAITSSPPVDRVDEGLNTTLSTITNAKVYAIKNLQGDQPGLFDGTTEVGEYYQMADEALNIYDEDYKSVHRDVKIYDEEVDDYAKISFLKALLKSLLFDKKGDVLPYESDKGLDDIEKSMDIFVNLYDNSKRYYIKRWGEMRKDYFSYQQAKNFVLYMERGLKIDLQPYEHLKSNILNTIVSFDSILRFFEYYPSSIEEMEVGPTIFKVLDYVLHKLCIYYGVEIKNLYKLFQRYTDTYDNQEGVYKKNGDRLSLDNIIIDGNGSGDIERVIDSYVSKFLNGKYNDMFTDFILVGVADDYTTASVEEAYRNEISAPKRDNVNSRSRGLLGSDIEQKYNNKGDKVDYKVLNKIGLELPDSVKHLTKDCNINEYSLYYILSSFITDKKMLGKSIKEFKERHKGNLNVQTLKNYLKSNQEILNEVEITKGFGKSLSVAHDTIYQKLKDSHSVENPKIGFSLRKTKKISTASTSTPGTLNKQIIRNYSENMSGKESPLWDIFCASFVTKSACESMYSNDIPIPINILLTRPHISHKSKRVVFMKAGMETMMTFMGNSQFSIANFADTQLIKGVYTNNYAIGVTNTKNICVQNDVLICGYNGGKNQNFHNYKYYDDILSDRYKSSSIIPIAYPITDCVTGRFNLAGRFIDNSFTFDDDSAVNSNLEQKTYITSGRYNHFYKFKKRAAEYHSQQTIYANQGEYRNVNLVCFQGQTLYYNSATKMYDRMKPGSGHHGNTDDVGAKIRRMNGLKFREPINTGWTRI